MSVQTAYVKTLINQWIRNYPVTGFQDMRLNTILNLMLDLLSGGGGGGTGEGVFKVTSADFTTSVNCPILALDGFNLAVYWNDTNKFLESGTDFTALVGGGFTMLVPGFDATTATFTFYVFIQTN